MFNAYTTNIGSYRLDFGEGMFKIYKDSKGLLKVKMSPKGNPTSYKHHLFKWDFNTPTSRTEDGFIYNTKFLIPTSKVSAMVCVEVIYDSQAEDSKDEKIC